MEYPLCIVLVLTFVPGNGTSSLVINIPVSINIGNKTVTWIVKIPVEVNGEVKSIYIKQKSGMEKSEIWATPAPTPTTTPVAQPAPVPAM